MMLQPLPMLVAEPFSEPVAAGMLSQPASVGWQEPFPASMPTQALPSRGDEMFGSAMLSQLPPLEGEPLDRITWPCHININTKRIK